MRCCKVAIEAHTYFFWAFLLLVLPVRWVFGFFIAAAVHELCHIGMLHIFRKNPLQLWVSPGGMKMDVPELSPVQEFFCTLAGPIGGLLLLSLGRWYPELALCAGVQSCYNLLPLYPLDGGRILRALANLLIPQYSDAVIFAAEVLVCTGLLVMGLCLKWSFPAIGVIVFLAAKVLSGKIPCKQTFLGVQ